MGKIKKKRSVQKRRAPKVTFEEQLTNDTLGLRRKQSNSEPKIKFRKEENEEEEKVVDHQLSRQILNQVRKQQKEIEGCDDSDDKALDTTTSLGDDNSDNSDGEMEGDYYQNHDDCVLEIDKEDEEAMEKFMSTNPAPRLTLADLIMEKISEKQTELKTQFSDALSLRLQDVDPRVREMYCGVKQVLKKYRSGKLPKAFKIIPKLRNWEQILFITDPASWSAAAMYQGTRIFASNLKENMAQRFYNLVLLPRIRDDIAEYKRLNFHLYQSLRKALFKPGAFMKGLVIPLCESNCTLREAIIVGSVLAKNSVPMLHSAAAMLKLAEMEYNGATSIFLRILFDKKYALPYRVVDAVVFHFLRFENDEREFPVLWHQSLLTFVQRYKCDISVEQREALRGLLRHQFHYSITPIVRRELDSATCRDDMICD